MDYKLKAKELFDKYDAMDFDHNESAKECALIAVGEVIEVLGELNYMQNGGRSDTYGISDWEEVKKEINKIRNDT